MIPPPISREVRRGRIHLVMTAQRLGEDLSVTLSGGDRPHLGAVALAAPGTPASALGLPKHREAELARTIAETLSSEFRVAVSVACGIHLDDILPSEITEVLAMADALTRDVALALEAQRRD